MAKNITFVQLAIAIMVLFLVSCTGGNKADQGKSGSEGKGQVSGAGGDSGSAAQGAGGGSQQVAVEVKRGNEVYIKSGCSKCHKIGDEGGSIGPDLSKVGQRRTMEEMSTLIRDPKALNPNANMPPQDISDEDLKYLVRYLAMLK